MKHLFLFSLLIISLSCNQGSKVKTEVGTGDFEGFTLTKYPQGDIQKAIKVDKVGQIILEGDVVDGKKEGAWIAYQGGVKKDVPISIINYHKGIRNGLSVEFDSAGRFSIKEYYANGHLEGRRVVQKFGQAQEESYYKNGVLDGPFYTYYPSGNLKIKGKYVNGKKEGQMVYYDMNGNPTMVYTYKNDEIVERKNLKKEEKSEK